MVWQTLNCFKTSKQKKMVSIFEALKNKFAFLFWLMKKIEGVETWDTPPPRRSGERRYGGGGRRGERRRRGGGARALLSETKMRTPSSSRYSPFAPQFTGLLCFQKPDYLLASSSALLHGASIFYLASRSGHLSGYVGGTGISPCRAVVWNYVVISAVYC